MVGCQSSLGGWGPIASALLLGKWPTSCPWILRPILLLWSAHVTPLHGPCWVLLLLLLPLMCQVLLGAWVRSATWWWLLLLVVKRSARTTKLGGRPEGPHSWSHQPSHLAGGCSTVRRTPLWRYAIASTRKLLVAPHLSILSAHNFLLPLLLEGNHTCCGCSCSSSRSHQGCCAEG